MKHTKALQKKKKKKNLTENRKNRLRSATPMNPHPSTSTRASCLPDPVQRIVSEESHYVLSLSPLSDREGAEVAGSTPKPEVQYQPPKKLHNEGRKGRERTNEPPTAAFTAEKKKKPM